MDIPLNQLRQVSPTTVQLLNGEIQCGDIAISEIPTVIEGLVKDLFNCSKTYYGNLEPFALIEHATMITNILIALNAQANIDLALVQLEDRQQDNDSTSVLDRFVTAAVCLAATTSVPEDIQYLSILEDTLIGANNYELWEIALKQLAQNKPDAYCDFRCIAIRTKVPETIIKLADLELTRPE